MRYHSLWLLSVILKVGAIIGAFIIIILSFIFLVRSIQVVEEVAQLARTPVTLQGYIVAATPSFYFLLGGLFACLVAFANGAFIVLMMDIEANVRTMAQRGDDDYTRRPIHGSWEQPAPVLQSPLRKSSPPARVDERSRAPSRKWDMGS